MWNPTASTYCRPAGSSAAAGRSSPASSNAKVMRRLPRDRARPHPWLYRVHGRDRHGARQSRPGGRRHCAAGHPVWPHRHRRHRPQPVRRHRKFRELRRGFLCGSSSARRALRPDGARPAEATRQAAAAADEEARMTAPFPTRKQEEWRYADLDALRPVWQQFAEPLTLTVGAGESFEKIWLPNDEPVQVRRIQIALGKDATARIFVLNSAQKYG